MRNNHLYFALRYLSKAGGLEAAAGLEIFIKPDVMQH